MRKHILFTLIPTLGCLAAHGLIVETTKVLDGEPLPFGYQEAAGPAPDFADAVDSEKSIRVSEAPFVDYMIPRNDGTIGILAQKSGGQFIVGTNAEDPGGGAYGSNQWPNPDRWHPVFEWTDGTPFPFGADYWGVSHSGWLPGDVLSILITRINLASDQEIVIHHWFNDGFKYSSWDTSGLGQDSHTLTVTHYNAQGAIVDEKFTAIPSGGAEDMFGDERMFAYSRIIATATAPGDFLIIMNAGGNIGFKGTAVSIGGDFGSTPGWDVEIGSTTENATLGRVYGYSEEWAYSETFGIINYGQYPWFYQKDHGWFADLEAGAQDVLDDGIFLYSEAYGFIHVKAADGGQFYRFDEGGSWLDFQP